MSLRSQARLVKFFLALILHTVPGALSLLLSAEEPLQLQQTLVALTATASPCASTTGTARGCSQGREVAAG